MLQALRYFREFGFVFFRDSVFIFDFQVTCFWANFSVMKIVKCSELNYSAVHNSGATLRNLSIFLFQAIFIHLYELCIYMLYIFVKGMLQVI